MYFRDWGGRVGVAALMIALLCSCDEQVAKHLVFGTTVPDARLRVTFSQPLQRTEVYRRLQVSMSGAGFPSFRGERPVEGESSVGATHWVWHPTEESNYVDDDYSIGTTWREETNLPSGFEFRFYQGGTHGFENEEWLLFFKFKDEYLPSAFPDALIEVTRHPAENTELSKLADITKSTGIPVPEYVKERFFELTGETLN
ncbi:MAG: hypothetical protein AAF438_04955 [Pseudomonadota bacterium]